MKSKVHFCIIDIDVLLNTPYIMNFSKDMQDLLGELFLPCDMPEPPKQSFFKGLFGGGVSQLDREELCKLRCKICLFFYIIGHNLV